MIEFSEQQRGALDDIKNWLRDGGRQVYRLFGYAGTGKTTIAKSLKEYAPNIQYGALTGKAALVLRSKGCEGARTIHSMIYRSMDKSKRERDQLQRELDALNGLTPEEVASEDIQKIGDLSEQIRRMNRDLQQPTFQLNEQAFERVWVEPSYDEERDQEFPGYFRLIDPPDLIVIDECSMVDERVGHDLESFGIPILVLGDPAQLPPVGGGGYFTGNEKRPVKPDYLLTEIHRQAADNPVLQIATAIRNGAMPEPGAYGDSRIVSDKFSLKQEDWLAADQVLCGRNATRHALNARLRELRGFSGFLPGVGERLVCLRNNHEKGLLNGSMWEVTEIQDITDGPYFSVSLKSLDDDAAEPVTTVGHKKPFMGEEFADAWERRTADEFDFGHCITTHKAQGSEWSYVIYVDEWPRWGDERRRHQYTGVTRASKRVDVVKW
jgi:exodeoxyribonuclease-5